jgi:hypothetical protein
MIYHSHSKDTKFKNAEDEKDLNYEDIESFYRQM